MATTHKYTKVQTSPPWLMTSRAIRSRGWLIRIVGLCGWYTCPLWHALRYQPRRRAGGGVGYQLRRREPRAKAENVLIAMCYKVL